MSNWIGNKCDVNNEENFLIHEYICRELSKIGFDENGVCDASVAVWGVIHIMRQKLDVYKLEIEMRNSLISDNKDEMERLRGIISKMDKELQELREKA